MPFYKHSLSVLYCKHAIKCITDMFFLLIHRTSDFAIVVSAEVLKFYVIGLKFFLYVFWDSVLLKEVCMGVSLGYFLLV